LRPEFEPRPSNPPTQNRLEWHLSQDRHLRIISLLVGLAVGIMSLVGMVRKMRRK
jgi:hypothetical protein